MGFFRNLINKTVERVMSAGAVPESRAAPVQSAVSRGFAGLLDAVVDRLRRDKPEKPEKPTKPDKPEKPEKPTKPDKPEKPEKPAKPEKAYHPEHKGQKTKKYKGAGVKQTFENLVKDEIILNFDINKIKSDFEFSALLDQIRAKINENNKSLVSYDLLISGFFATKTETDGSWRALSPLLPTPQAMTYAAKAGLNIANYKSNQPTAGLRSLSFRFVPPQADRERGE